MAKRQGTRRIDSTEVMGEGSYVIVMPIPYDKAREAFRKREELSPDEAEAFVTNLIANAIKEWDWVDYDDTSLPVPKDGDELASTLAVHEVQFLARNLLPSEAETKN